MDDEVFVLLDDCHASEAVPSSRLYSGYVRELRCTDPRTLDAFWQAVTADQLGGLHAVVFADYEWGTKLQCAGLQQVDANSTAALRAFLFSQLEHLSSDGVADWLAQRDGSASPSPAGVCGLQPSVDQARFAQDVARVRELISQGETYQVNYTFRIHGAQYGTPIGLYRRLRAMQPVSFGALACLPGAKADDTTWVLSSSPELFVRNQDGHLTTRPMKGTATRLTDPTQDQQRATWLSQDAKNRAENVMIVDLLRNDLGRIAEIGSVTVPNLFVVETYKTVHQMTSTVQAHMREDVRFPEVLRALFPCGSITGAPKVHTMDLIADLECEPRGLYCGAIGWVDAPTTASPAGDFCLSVAIRTLVLGPEHQGRRAATLGVGNGIVLDSEAGDEFAETHAKTRYLTAMDPGFTLFETMRVSRGRVCHLPWHLQRLQASARALGFACDLSMLEQTMASHVAALDIDLPYRLRLDLRHDGSLNLQHTVLTPLPHGPALLVLSRTPVPTQEAALLTHKTSLRSGYDAAIQKAMALGAFDTIFLNAQDKVTEGARSSLLIQRDGRWFTPPLSSGVLAGVMRHRLLQRYPTITEQAICLEDALSAQALAVCSALRGLQRAQWVKDVAGEIVRV